MKKILLSAIIFAAAVGCAKTDTPTPEPQVTTNKISLSASVNDLSVSASSSSRAAVTGDVAITGLQLLRKDASTLPASFADATLVVANRALGGAITFNPDQYYKGTDKAFYVGYYPVATSVTANVASLNVDGKTDIMTAAPVDAGTDALPLAPAMAFSHALAQLEIICKPEAGLLTEVKTRWGKISSIKLKSAFPSMTYTYSSQVAAGAGAKVPFALLKSDYATAFAAIDIPAENNTTVNAAAMVAPSLSTEKTIILLIDTEKMPEREVTVTFNAAGYLEAGKRHTITLTFNTKGVKVTASAISACSTGSTGASAVD